MKPENMECYICGQFADTWDHVIPKHKGGTNDPNNIEPCCSKCNNIKGSYTFPIAVLINQTPLMRSISQQYGWSIEGSK